MPVTLDVTNVEHLTALPDVLPDRLDAVVNNAGVVVGGPIESVTTEAWRHQFDVNVVGQFAVTRAVLPNLRRATGRAVFISSVNGRISMPMMGPYSASKFALESAADALRMELKAWGMPVSIIEPAQTDTDMWRTVEDFVADMEAGMSDTERELYVQHLAALKKALPVARKMAVPVSRVARVVERALTERRPRARYVVGAGPKVQAAVMTNLPIGLRDWLLTRLIGLPRRA